MIKMDSSQNAQIRSEAVRKLETVSSSLVIDKYPEINISLLKEMFLASSRTMQANPEDEKLYTYAESLFESCIHVSRCVLVDNPNSCYALINKTTYHLHAHDQYENALRNYNDFNEYKNC